MAGTAQIGTAAVAPPHWSASKGRCACTSLLVALVGFGVAWVIARQLKLEHRVAVSTGAALLGGSSACLTWRRLARGTAVPPPQAAPVPVAVVAPDTCPEILRPFMVTAATLATSPLFGVADPFPGMPPARRVATQQVQFAPTQDRFPVRTVRVLVDRVQRAEFLPIDYEVVESLDEVLRLIGLETEAARTFLHDRDGRAMENQPTRPLGEVLGVVTEDIGTTMCSTSPGLANLQEDGYRIINLELPFLGHDRPIAANLIMVSDGFGGVATRDHLQATFSDLLRARVTQFAAYHPLVALYNGLRLASTDAMVALVNGDIGGGVRSNIFVQVQGLLLCASVGDVRGAVTFQTPDGERQVVQLARAADPRYPWDLPNGVERGGYITGPGRFLDLTVTRAFAEQRPAVSSIPTITAIRVTQPMVGLQYTCGLSQVCSLQRAVAIATEHGHGGAERLVRTAVASRSTRNVTALMTGLFPA